MSTLFAFSPSSLLFAAVRSNPKCTAFRFPLLTSSIGQLNSTCNGKIGSRISTGLGLLRLQHYAKASPTETGDAQEEEEAFLQDSQPSGRCDPLCSVDEMSSLDYEDNYKPKTDMLKATVIGAGLLIGAAVINHSWVAENQNLAMALVFVVGYGGIIFEESLAFNKSGVGLLMAVTLWVIRSLGALNCPRGPELCVKCPLCPWGHRTCLHPLL